MLGKILSIFVSAHQLYLYYVISFTQYYIQYCTEYFRQLGARCARWSWSSGGACRPSCALWTACVSSRGLTHTARRGSNAKLKRETVIAHKT